MSVEVNTVVVQPAVPKLRSRESSVFQDMLSNDAERAKNALARCEAFKAGQRIYDDEHDAARASGDGVGGSGDEVGGSGSRKIK